MSEFMNVIIILLTIAGWSLIAFAAKDIFVTAKLGVNSKRENDGGDKAELFYRSSTSRLTSAVLRLTKANKNRQFFLQKIGLIVPFSQYLIWKTMLVVGFGFLYLALDWQDIGDKANFQFFDEIGSTFLLSLSIFTSLAHYEFAPGRIGIHVLANIQFYAGFIFYAFIFIYFLTLRRRAKKVQPFLYNLKNESENYHSPFELAENLRQYGANELSVILQDWEIWANDLRVNFKASPTLIFKRSPRENRSWLASANVILDATAAVLVTSDGALKRQAKQTFSAVRRAVTETADFLHVIPQRAHYFPDFHGCLTSPKAEEDILSAEIIGDETENYFASESEKKLAVRRFTYQSYLTSLAEHLEIDLPPQREKKNFEFSF